MGLIDGLLTGFFGATQQAWQNRFNKVEAQKNRDFQSEEAQINRDFQSQEAEIARVFSSNEAALQRNWSAAEAERARDWQEEQNAKYNSLAGKVQQAHEAGVNPMLAITGAAGGASVSASNPSGSAASAPGSPSGSAPGGSAATNGMLNILGAMLDAASKKSEIEVNESLANKNNAEAENSGADTALKERALKIMTEHNLDVREIESRINLNTEQATQAFALAEESIERCVRLTQEKDFFESTKDDQAKLIEYNKQIAEFESSLSRTIDSLDSGEKQELSDWVGAIFKVLLGI